MEVLLHVAKFPPYKKSFPYFHRALTAFLRNNTGGIWHEGKKHHVRVTGRPTAIEWVDIMESSIIILNSFNGNFYFSNPARNNNPVRILVMQYKTLHLSLPLRMRRVNVTMKMSP